MGEETAQGKEANERMIIFGCQKEFFKTLDRKGKPKMLAMLRNKTMPALPNARARRKRAYNLATGAFAAGSSNRAATAAKAKPNQSGKLCLRTAGRANRGVIEILARNRRDRC